MPTSSSLRLAAVLGLCAGTAATGGTTPWSLARPVSPAAAGATDQTAAVRDPAEPSGGEPAAGDMGGFRIAPTIGNILNSRHDLTEVQTGLGATDGYVKSVGRTFGLALRKSLF